MSAVATIVLHCDAVGCGEEWVGGPGQGLLLARREANVRAGWVDAPDNRPGNTQRQRRDFCIDHSAIVGAS